MRKVSFLVLAVAMAMIISPARGETIQWASHAVASSAYGQSPEGALSGLAFEVVGPLFGAAGVVEPAIGPAAEVLLCSALGMSPCVPDPEEFAGDTADGASEIPERAPGFVEGLPDALVNSLTGLPDAIANALDNLLGNGNWGSGQATGEPNTYPSCGDIATAWAPQSSGPDPESITLFYNPPVANATRIDIYETNVGGFVTSVDVTLADGTVATVFTGPDTTGCPGILSIALAGDQTVVAVTVNTQASGWEEIDAVGVAS